MRSLSFEIPETIKNSSERSHFYAVFSRRINAHVSKYVFADSLSQQTTNFFTYCCTTFCGWRLRVGERVMQLAQRIQNHCHVKLKSQS